MLLRTQKYDNEVVYKKGTDTELGSREEQHWKNEDGERRNLPDWCGKRSWDHWYSVTCLCFEGKIGWATVSNQARSSSLYANKNHPVRLAGSMQERGMVSKPAAVFYIQRRVAHSELVDLQSRKNHHSSDRKDKSEWVLCKLFTRVTQDCMDVCEEHRKSSVCQVCTQMWRSFYHSANHDGHFKRTKPKNHQWVIQYQTYHGSM